MGLSSREKIATHLRLFEKNRYCLDLFHYLDTLRQKSRALNGSVVLNQAHQTLQGLYEKYFQQKPKDFIDLLLVCREHPILNLVMDALDAIMQQGLIPSRELLINVLHQSPDPEMIPFCYDKIPAQVNIPDFQIYDQMLVGGSDG